MERILLHCDMDRFYCACEEKHNPKLSKIPFAVCGDPQMRHSIVMSANSLARQYGVRAGLRFADARKLCPSLKYITADYSKYLVETKTAREVYNKYADKIIPYGLDESWILLEDGVSWHEAQRIAELIRIEVMYAMGLSASVGVSYNLIFSKIGSDYNKPNGTTIITRNNYRDIIWPMAAKKLLFVGEVRERTLASHGIKTIGDIANTDPEHLKEILKGKIGYDLYQYANGIDKSFKPETDQIGSIGNTITPPKDLRNTEEVSAVIYTLASAVCARLKKHGLKTRCIAVNMKDNQFNTTTRQCSLPAATDHINHIFNQAYRLFQNHYKWLNPLRSLGVRATNLDHCHQLSLFDDADHVTLDTDVSIQLKRLTQRFGKLKLESAGALGRW